MNTHDKIELPPLPPADRYFEFDSHRMKASIDIPYWGEKSLEAYARAAIEPYAKRIAELEAARFAYASEFPPNEDGDPDVGSIHENIRKLKAELEADRKRRGFSDERGPVNKTNWNAELASWSDEDFIRIFHERPDLANRLRKILAEPVKRKRLYAPGSALGEFGVIPMCDQYQEEMIGPELMDQLAKRKL